MPTKNDLQNTITRLEGELYLARATINKQEEEIEKYKHRLATVVWFVRNIIKR